MFGLASAGPALGFSQGAAGGDGPGGEEQSREAVLGPVLDVLSSFRDRARTCGRAGDAKGVMAACDHVRDEMLPTVGVRLEDKGDQVRPGLCVNDLVVVVVEDYVSFFSIPFFVFSPEEIWFCGFLRFWFSCFRCGNFSFLLFVCVLSFSWWSIL